MFCKNCGKELADDCNFCSNCGTKLKDNHTGSQRDYKRYETPRENNEQFYKQTWFGILMLCVFWPVGLYLLLRYGGKAAKVIGSLFGVMIIGVFLTAIMGALSIHSTNSEDSSENPLVAVMQERQSNSVPSQQAFNDLLAEYGKAYKNAKTDLQKADVANQYQNKIDNFLGNGHVENWVAKVDRIEASYDNKEAKIFLIYYVGDVKYEVSTGIVDMGKIKTLVPIGSNVYKKATDLIKGDIVSFSGRFVKRYGEESYFNKYSYNNTSPELLFKFDDIELERSAPKRIM